MGGFSQHARSSPAPGRMLRGARHKELGTGQANRNIPTMEGRKTSHANQVFPPRVVLRLYQLNSQTASPNARRPPMKRMMTEPQGEKSATFPIANPLKAFIDACSLAFDKK